MAAKDVEFARQLDEDMTLRVPFAKAMSEVYLDHSYDRPFINNATLGRIRSGLVNKADFAVAQKEYFMTNESSLDPEEKAEARWFEGETSDCAGALPSEGIRK